MFSRRAKDERGYGKRKIEVLRYVAKHPSGISPSELGKALKINYDLARALLYKYRRQKLLTRRKRGVYRISQRGRDRLRYLEQRLKIGEVTGIDIGLNHHKDYSHPLPIWEIMKQYQALGGIVYPGFAL